VFEGRRICRSRVRGPPRNSSGHPRSRNSRSASPTATVPAATHDRPRDRHPSAARPVRKARPAGRRGRSGSQAYELGLGPRLPGARRSPTTPVELVRESRPGGAPPRSRTLVVRRLAEGFPARHRRFPSRKGRAQVISYPDWIHEDVGVRDWGEQEALLLEPRTERTRRRRRSTARNERRGRSAWRPPSSGSLPGERIPRQPCRCTGQQRHLMLEGDVHRLSSLNPRPRAGWLAEARCRQTCTSSNGRRGASSTKPGFDRALVDAPCSGLGRAQTRRPDLRWRAKKKPLAGGFSSS